MTAEKSRDTLCKNCCSGYAVDPGLGDEYCGYCGSRLKSLVMSLAENDYASRLIYADQSGPITLKIRAKNTGMVDLDDIGELVISDSILG